MKIRRLKPDELQHHGVKGQKWGVRRYQNPDGTLTAEGRARFGTVEGFNRAQTKKKKLLKHIVPGVGIAAGITGATALAARKQYIHAANWEGNGPMVRLYEGKMKKIQTVGAIAATGALAVSTYLAAGGSKELKRIANVSRGKEYSRYALKQIEKERVNDAINKIENNQMDHELEDLNKKK